jgi:hypothetical protein
MNKILLVWLSTLVMSAPLQGQDFTNLNFESAQIIVATNSAGFIGIAASTALPGWSAFSGTNQLSQVDYNPSPLGVPAPVDLVGSNAEVVDGNFSVLLADNTGSISQTGLVSSGTESLFFDGSSGQFSLLVSLGGVNLSYTVVSSGINSYGLSYSTYAADVSGFAGQVETLTFSGTGVEILDDIQFSPEIIPEPSAASLLFLGSGILMCLCARKKFRLN